ncbi:MAG: hypothetical protein HYU78_11135 [Rhodocyclales bacterium]|nr:hypothetical protein [Rhodocyclales bacterium]
MTSRLSMLLLLLACSGLSPAQTVYESKSGQGKVYSDRPVPGAKAVELRPLTVIEPLPVAPAAAAPRDDGGKQRQEAVPAYRSLRVVFPEAGGSVAANNATFEVRVAVDPPLLVEKGHAFALRLDGRPVPGRFTATEMMIPPEFFGEVAPAGGQRHVLEVSIVDAGGQSLLTAPPVDFQTRYVTFLQRPHGFPFRPSPVPVPTPPTLQKTPLKATPAPASEPPAEGRLDGRRIDR